MHAARLGLCEIIKLLIEKGANLTITNNQGKTALDYAREYNHPDIVDILKRA